MSMRPLGSVLARNTAVIAPRITGYHMTNTIRQFGAGGGRQMTLVPHVPNQADIDVGPGKKFKSADDKFKLKVPLPPEGSREREWVRPDLDWTPPFTLMFFTAIQFWIIPEIFPVGIV